VLVKNIGARADRTEAKRTMLKQIIAKEFNPKNLCPIRLRVDNCIKLKKVNCLSVKYPLYTTLTLTNESIEFTVDALLLSCPHHMLSRIFLRL
jgi:hypothetical protein